MKTFQQFQEEAQTITEIKKRLIGAALLATPYLMKKFLKPKTDKMLDTERKTNKIGGDYRSGNTSDFESGVNAIKQKKEDKKNKKTRVFGDPTGQYSDFFN
tara:strand:- start:43 stop:345 length:303 start_codon:yes stop_codon:yes gene_type:complete